MQDFFHQQYLLTWRLLSLLVQPVHPNLALNLIMFRNIHTVWWWGKHQHPPQIRLISGWQILAHWCRTWILSGMLEPPRDNSASSIEHQAFLVIPCRWLDDVMFQRSSKKIYLNYCIIECRCIKCICVERCGYTIYIYINKYIHISLTYFLSV